MRSVAWSLVLLLLGCGGEPLLANAPHPNNAAMAGGAAAAAAALTLADPDAATRKPEKKQEPEKQPVEVNETVPSDVFDRAEHHDTAKATGSNGSAPAAAKKPSGPPPKLPSPRDAVDGGGTPAGSAAEWRRGSIDGGGTPAGSAAEWRRGSIDKDRP